MARISTAVLIAAASLIGFVQPAAAQMKGEGFAYGGPMTVFERGAGTGLASFGAGGDALAANGGGMSVEFGLLGRGEIWAARVSVDAMYQKPPSAESRVTPFILGGYTGFLGSGGGAHGINIGGGVNLWTRPRMAIRIEARDHILPSEGPLHALEFRFGVTFR